MASRWVPELTNCRFISQLAEFVNVARLLLP